ncbi:MAG: PPC domain-containing DNA-binding protein [Candidatus Aenigmatarchaeota archaeon]
MKYKKSGDAYVILLEKGDRIIDSLLRFCTKEKIKAGSLSGIGGVAKAEVAYYDMRDKKYHARVFDKPPYEVVSLKGNVSIAAEKLKIHAHIVLSDSEFRAFGGHLNEADVSPMCEIIFIPLKAKLHRKKDAETGLMFLDL